MYFEAASILIYLLVSVAFIMGSLIAGKLIRRQIPTSEKLSTYECGEETIGTSWVQFNVRFYVIALIFLIFDVEIAILFPWTTIFAEARGLVLAEIAIFMLILGIGFAYVWAKGDLEWLKSLDELRTAESSKEVR